MTDFSVPMPKRSSLKRSTKPIRARKKAARKVGKHTGIVRLAGDDLKGLRDMCFELANGFCDECRKSLFYETDWKGHPDRYHMAHIKARGAGGSDTLDNVRALCGDCHRAEHGNPKAPKFGGDGTASRNSR